MKITARNTIKQNLFNVARTNFIEVSNKLYNNKLPETNMYKVSLTKTNRQTYIGNNKPSLTTGQHPYDYSMNGYRPKLWVSFANKYLGGGFLGEDYVQEEIITLEFYQMAEMIVKKNIPLMAENEAYIFQNLIRSSISDPVYYKSYKKAQLKHVDSIQVADFLAIDAPRRVKREDPYTFEELRHLCVKSFCGFTGCAKLGHTEINTGNWGAGVFYNQYAVIYFVQLLSAWLVGIERIEFWMMPDNKDVEQVIYKFVDSKDIDTFFNDCMKMLKLGKYTMEQLYSI